MKLTGRTRYRAQTRFMKEPILVLMVQEEGLVCDLVGGAVECQQGQLWRDARVEDLVTLAAIGALIEAHKCATGASNLTNNDRQEPAKAFENPSSA